jgi:hypothetical protein
MNIAKLVRSDYLKLLPILGLAFYLAFLPHHNYPYPVHLDEWIHLSCTNEVIKEGNVLSLSDPFSGGAPITNQSVEVGFHVFLAVFRQISGVSWLTIFRYLPGLIFVITVLSAYVLGRRMGFGWEAALTTCLVPTTIGILGPGFLVPVALGLLFIPLCLFVAFYFRNWGAYVMLFIFTLFLLAMHSATAIGMITILIPYVILNLRGNLRHAVTMAAALAIPCLIALPWLSETLAFPAAAALLVQTRGLVPYVDVPRIIPIYGYLPILLCVIGCAVPVIRGGRERYGLIFGLLVLLVLLALFFKTGYGIDMMYYRGLLFMMLMMSIVAGFGLAAVWNLRIPPPLAERFHLPALLKYLGGALCLVLIFGSLYTAIPVRQHIVYYHMIDDQEYRDFVWIRDNLDEGYGKAILDPLKGAPFTAITGKNVYTWLGAYPIESDFRAYGFLAGGSTDTAFLRNNNISIVYSRQNVNNPDLTEVRPYVYLLKEAEQ